MNPIPVLFEDGEALIIDKPAGLPIERPRAGGPCLEDRASEFRLGFARSPVPVHRIDTDTSGCLLLARNPKAHKKFAAAFEAGEVEKTYLAVLDGIPAAPSGVIDMALGKTSTAQSGWRMVADPKGKAAITNWDIVATYEGRALVRFCPKTGRTHQLRVHAATGLGLPISGDPVYGAGKGPMLLHAHSLRLPRGAKPPIVAEAPLPASFATAGFAALPPQNG